MIHKKNVLHVLCSRVLCFIRKSGKMKKEMLYYLNHSDVN